MVEYTDEELLECKDLDKLSFEQLAKLQKLRKIQEMNTDADLRKESLYNNHPELAPKSKIPLPGGESKNIGDNTQAIYNNFWARNEKLKTPSNYTNDSKEELKDARFQVWENQRWQEAGVSKLFSNADSDTGCADNVSDWSPADTYAKVVWESFVCKADLFKLAVKGIAINPGDGLSVQIRTFGAFGTPSSLGSCECASCGSISFTTYTLTLKQLNLESIVCAKDIWDVGSVLMDSYLIAMGNSWAQYFDAQIYSELETAVAGTDITLPNALSCTASIGGSCCTDTSLVDLINGIYEGIASMREATIPYNPDYMIISPSVARIFKRFQTPTQGTWMQDIKFDADGRLAKIGGLTVIEYCGANSCTNLSGQEVAIIVDSRRAVGAVFGEKPKLYKEFQSNCNSYRLDQWSFFAVSELDVNAICHILNP